MALSRSAQSSRSAYVCRCSCVQPKATSGCSQYSTSWPETKPRLRWLEVSMMPSGGGRVGNERVEIEAGVFEVAAEPDAARVDEVKDGRDHLGFTAGMVGDGLHQFGHGHVLGHGPVRSCGIGFGRYDACLHQARDGASNAHRHRNSVRNVSHDSLLKPEGVDAAAPTPLRRLTSIALQGRMERSVPVAIQNPRAPFGFWGFAMVAMRTRKSGLAHTAGMPGIMPEKRAFPWPSIETSPVSSSASVWSPALQTSVPVTAFTGPVVPLKTCPMITSPCTSKSTAPVSRFTRAWPSRADHANVAGLTLPTGLKFSAVWVAGLSVAVITPTMCFQCTSAASAGDAHSAASTKPTSATLFFDCCFMTDSLRWVMLRGGPRIADDSRRSRGGGPWMSVWRQTAFGDGSVTARTRTSGHDWRHVRRPVWMAHAAIPSTSVPWLNAPPAAAGSQDVRS